MADLDPRGRWTPTMSPQLRDVFSVMRDGEWHTLADIAATAGVPEPSASARLRELRLTEHGAWHLESRRSDDDRFGYRLVEATATEPAQLDLGLDPGPVAAPAPRRAGLVLTVGQARRWLRARLREGATCPVCDQHAQTYRRKITKPMVNALIAMARAGALTGWRHMPTVVGAHRADEAKLAYWGLLEEERTLRDDGGRAGYWRITPRGEAFLKGDLSVPKYALVYNGQCVGHEGERVTAEDCLDHQFDLAQLLAGV